MTGHKWYQWHEPGTSTAEKRLLSKLDCVILLYTCLTFFTKYLCQTNVTNAWVAGLHNDPEIRPAPNDLNLLTTYFNIGVIIGCVLVTPLLSMLPPSRVLPACTIIWSFFVLFMYKATSIETLFGLRFCAGLFEAVAYPGAFYIIGSWYRPSEIHRRSTIFLFSSVAGGMSSGFIQAGLTQGMQGRLGLPAWRWLFIFNFVIALPVAAFGLFCCPDSPVSKPPWWMTLEEHDLALKRMHRQEEGIFKRPTASLLIRVFLSWQLYAFTIAYGIMEVTCGTLMNRWFVLFLQKLPQYSAPDQSWIINELSTAVGGSQLIWLLVAGVAADALKSGVHVLFCLAFVQLFAYIVFAVWPENVAFRFAMYLVGGCYEAIPALLAAWANICCQGNEPLRAFTVGAMIAMGYTCETLSQQFVFPTSDAPRFKPTNGYIFGSAWVGIFIIYTCGLLPRIVRHMQRREASNA